MGILIGAGHDPDDLLSRYSFEQLALYGRCIMRSRAQMLNALLSPLVDTFSEGSAKWKNEEVPAPSRQGPRPKTRNGISTEKRGNTTRRSFKLSEAGDTPQEREDAFFSALRSLGKR